MEAQRQVERRVTQPMGVQLQQRRPIPIKSAALLLFHKCGESVLPRRFIQIAQIVHVQRDGRLLLHQLQGP